MLRKLVSCDASLTPCRKLFAGIRSSDSRIVSITNCVRSREGYLRFDSSFEMTSPNVEQFNGPQKTQLLQRRRSGVCADSLASSLGRNPEATVCAAGSGVFPALRLPRVALAALVSTCYAAVSQGSRGLITCFYEAHVAFAFLATRPAPPPFLWRTLMTVTSPVKTIL